MSSSVLARSATLVAAAAFVFTGGAHTTGYTSIVAASASFQEPYGGLIQALWLVYGFHLIAIGLVVAALAWRRGPTNPTALTLCGLVPAVDASLQVHFIGFVPPTVLLAGTSLVTLIAAGLTRTAPMPADRPPDAGGPS